MDIAESGNPLMILKSEKWWYRVSPERCSEAWEEIVRRNAEENGSYDYQNYLNNLKEYYRLISEHTLVKAALLKLSYKVDPILAKYLTSRGYVIRLGKQRAVDSEAYANSIFAAVKKSDNLVTKIRMKRKEMTNTTNLKGNSKTFEAMMASLISLLGFEVNSNITLARYNEYKKFIKQKYKPKVA